jgi:hypothetical protein
MWATMKNTIKKTYLQNTSNNKLSNRGLRKRSNVRVKQDVFNYCH